MSLYDTIWIHACNMCVYACSSYEHTDMQTHACQHPLLYVSYYLEYHLRYQPGISPALSKIECIASLCTSGNSSKITVWETFSRDHMVIRKSLTWWESTSGNSSNIPMCSWESLWHEQIIVMSCLHVSPLYASTTLGGEEVRYRRSTLTRCYGATLDGCWKDQQTLKLLVN